MSRADWRSIVHGIVGGATLKRDHAEGYHQGMVELHERYARWFTQPNVVAIGVGPKLRRGKRRARSIQVFVREKRRLGTFDEADEIKGQLEVAVRGVREQVLVDVRPVGNGRPQSLYSFERPALPGYDVGSQAGLAGTIGCLVRDRDTGTFYGLTCAHVLSVDGKTGQPIYVPSLQQAQGRTDEARIGTVKLVVPIGFSSDDGRTNVDAALFEPANPAHLARSIAMLGRPTGVRASVSDGMRVWKVGAASQQTSGTIQSVVISVKHSVVGADGSTREAIFNDQIGVTNFTKPGDSGSLVVDQARQAVGLHFWASDSLSVCQPIQRVLDAVRCDLA